MPELVRNCADGKCSLGTHKLTDTDKSLAANLYAVERIGTAAGIVRMVPEIFLRISAVGGSFNAANHEHYGKLLFLENTIAVLIEFRIIDIFVGGF